MKYKSLFQNILFYTAVVSFCGSVAPSVQSLLTTGKWNRSDNWILFSSAVTSLGITWARYLDQDGTVGTPRGIIGRDIEPVKETVEDIIRKAADRITK